MAENPLVHVPQVWPLVNRANQIRRNVVGNLRSFDIIRWNGTPYGPDPAQCLDLQELNDLCPRDGWPTVLLIHGGGWTEGDKEHFAAMSPVFARQRIMGVAMNYRLAPQFKWPAQLDDVLLAIDFLQQQQIDLSRLALWGASAGGHLALMAALKRPEAIRCVVTIGAVTDVERLPVDSWQEVFETSDLQDASPIHQRGQLPPTLMLHGEQDRTVSVDHTIDFAKHRREVETMIVPDGDHGLRWPLIGSYRAKRSAMSWLIKEMDLPPVGSKWKRRSKKTR